MNFATPLQEVGLTYKLQAKKLERLGIRTIGDLLLHIPQRYEDLSLISPIRILQPGETVTIKGSVILAKNEYTRRRFRIQKVKVTDATGSIECIWFNQPFILKTIKMDSIVSVSGKVDYFGKILALLVKEYELIETLSSPTTHTGRLVPIYPETRGLSSKWIRNRVKDLLSLASGELSEYLPPLIIQNHHLISFEKALQQIHFPESRETAQTARYRLSFDELFLTQLVSMLRRKEWEEKKVTHFFSIAPHKEKIQQFWKQLPFELTNAQKRAVREIFADLASATPMNRLLEGDVGSGKTVVSAIALYIAYLNRFQSAFMAPTEILAQQHYETICTLLTPLGVKVGLSTGSKKLKDKTKQNIYVGTHALLNTKLQFDNLGFVVIDEQQRFGVTQRSILREKGVNPHFLTMTATPIPRTIFLTLYGDLELSYLDEMPKGRKKIKTWLVPLQKREAAYEWIKKKILEKNDQVFIICPFIEESETMTTVKAAVDEYEKLTHSVFSQFNVGLLHGKLKAKEKQETLLAFRNGKTHILVATPVVEVGIDIPNATIMLVEAAERFGLAQLHQLRGRVGRGVKESFCLLFTESKSPRTHQRLKYLEKSYVGAELAELDLKLRGPGEIYGTLQHGAPELKIASFSDFPLIEKARREAEKVFPHLSSYPLLYQKVKSTIIGKSSPD